MFRWIVKLIRDEFGIDEKILVRTATLETDIGLSIEQVEQVLEYIAESFPGQVSRETPWTRSSSWRSCACSPVG